MKDKISALMDGELDDQTAARMLEVVASDREARDAWSTYHLISDALGKSRMLSEGFGERVAAALAAEPTVLAPRRLGAAREPRRWVALAAGVAAVSLVGWLGFAPQLATQVAKAPAPVVSKDAKPAMVALPSGTSDYLLAHQGFSPRMSLVGIAPYVRTVSEPAREARR